MYGRHHIYRVTLAVDHAYHAYRVTPCSRVPSMVDIRKRVRQLSCSQTDRQNERQTNSKDHITPPWRNNKYVCELFSYEMLNRQIKQVYRRRYESRRSSKPKLHFKKNKIKFGEKRFSIRRMELLHLQCGTIMTFISPGDCTLQCGIWLWNRDSKFTKWQHPAM